MDKNNDIQVNKVSKWEAAPISIKNLRNYISESWKDYAAPPCCPPLDPSCQDSICESMMAMLESVLDDYNELEAKHQKDTGIISQYEEENRNLKSELDIKTDECDALISRVFKQDDEYTKLEAENKDLRMTCEPLKKVILKLQDEYNSIAMENKEMHSKCEFKEDILQKMIKEVTELEKEKIELEDRLTQQKRKDIHEIVKKHNTISHLKAEIRDLESELKQVIELAKSYGVIIYDERKDTKPDDAINISMCGPYYVLDEQIKNENAFLKDRCNELSYRNAMRTHYIQLMADESKWLKKKDEEIKKENDNLKQTLLNILEKLETKVGLCRIHLLDSYEDRANRIMVEYEKLKETNKSLRRTVRFLDEGGSYYELHSYPVACECENFKPDDLPDMDHS